MLFHILIIFNLEDNSNHLRILLKAIISSVLTKMNRMVSFENWKWATASPFSLTSNSLIIPIYLAVISEGPNASAIVNKNGDYRSPCQSLLKDLKS